MKALKILVIAMGLLIVIGIGLVGYGLTRGKPRPAALPAAVETGSLDTVFATQYPVPKGMKLRQITSAGDRIVLHLEGADGDRLVVLNSHTGQLAGTIDLTPESK